MSAIERACRRVAPLWPLRRFVAVNPFLGFTDRSFEATCATLRRVAGVEMLMPRSFYRQAVDAGVIGDVDLETALARASLPGLRMADVAALRRALATDPAPGPRPRAVVATVADVLDRLAGGDRRASRTALMVDEISRWCATYFDAGQAAWRSPWRTEAPYRAWRAAMRHDRTAEMMGIRSFRQTIAALPEEPIAAIGTVLERLGIPERAVEDYLHRALIDIGGWAAFARQRLWESELRGERDTTLLELLAIRVVWGYALFEERTDAAFREEWRHAMAEAAALPADDCAGEDPELALDLVLQLAYEAAYERDLRRRLAVGRVGAPTAATAFQAAFCIDVRSEVYRRALEGACPEAETFGFAGFFGLPLEYVPIGQVRGEPHCPVLLKPAFVVCEGVDGASVVEETAILGLRLLRRRVVNAWKAFKLSAVSCFAFVETAGLLYARRLLSDSLALTRPVAHPKSDGLDADVVARLGPRIDPGISAGRRTGFDVTERVDMAEAILRAMSLTRHFSRLVLLVGHGSTTVNNPYASALDCGACGGNTGEANARVAAAVLNDPAVRDGLCARGIEIPAETVFVGALHDTTTDDVRVFAGDTLPGSHAADLRRLEQALARASQSARAERARRFARDEPPASERRIRLKSRDWSEVRPEWGLAGNAAFIAAPRERTRGVDLGGRVFLHSYEWRDDPGFRVLEQILTAPMVVASWINLQYYASTVNNRAFGSGNKLLHNVVGTLGVLEGYGGDLRVGLPWQSVHDGRRFVHDPLRLHVIVDAPVDGLNTVIRRQDPLRQRVEHGWLHLYAMGEGGRITHRCRRDGTWERFA